MYICPPQYIYISQDIDQFPKIFPNVHMHILAMKHLVEDLNRAATRQGLRSANETLDQIQKSLEATLRRDILGKILGYREDMNEDTLW